MFNLYTFHVLLGALIDMLICNSINFLHVQSAQPNFNVSPSGPSFRAAAPTVLPMLLPIQVVTSFGGAWVKPHIFRGQERY